jgi:UDP-2-acetamido-2-deoxy-ribo-hexuluronate aminotransferase
MDTLQCAMVLGKLERFDWELQRRAELGARYGELIRAAGLPLQLLAVRPDRSCVWAQYTVLLDSAAQRAAVQQHLQAQGVPTAVHYPKPLHHQPAFAAGHDPAAWPQSVRAAQRVLSLPMSADLTQADQDRVVQALASALRAAAQEAQPA